ncbi:hypothetical protein VPH35_056594 [Triticum aestivum]
MTIQIATTTSQERETARARRTGTARMVGPCPSFSTLPDDLLVIVYRLLADRAALPWLLLSPRGTRDRTWRALCHEDGATISLQPRRGAAYAVCLCFACRLLPRTARWGLGVIRDSLVGGYDRGWVVFSQPLLRIVNLFTGTEMPLSEKKSRIACPRANPPTSDGCIMAAMTENCGIMLCSSGRPGEGWTICGYYWFRFKDIAICNGYIYGSPSNNLLKFEISVKKDGDLVVTDDSWIDMQMLTSTSPYKENTSYIVDLNGKLMVVVMNRWWNYPKPFFRVFKLISIWIANALFLGLTFSKAVHMLTDSHGDMERNHIYYSNGRSRNFEAHSDVVSLTISNTSGDITLVGYFVKDNGYDSMWLLPPDI